MEVCILNTQDVFEAMLAQSKLESYGILCELRTNDARGTLPHLRNASRKIVKKIQTLSNQKF